MDKQKEIEKMLEKINENFPNCRDFCNDGKKCFIKNGLADCVNCTRAVALLNAGYGDVRYVVKDVLNKVFRYVEEARLECEFQDKDGKWFIDESEFICEFTLGKLQELYREYGIEMFGDSEQVNNEKGDMRR